MRDIDIKNLDVEQKECPFCGSFEKKFKNHNDLCFLKKFESISESNGKTIDKNTLLYCWNKRFKPSEPEN